MNSKSVICTVKNLTVLQEARIGQCVLLESIKMFTILQEAPIGQCVLLESHASINTWYVRHYRLLISLITMINACLLENNKKF